MLRALSVILLVLAIALIASRRRLIRVLEREGADSPQDAVRPPSTRLLTRLWTARLAKAGVIRRTGENRIWVDRVAWRKYRQTRQQRLLMAVTILGLVSLGLMISGKWAAW